MVGNIYEKLNAVQQHHGNHGSDRPDLMTLEGKCQEQPECFLNKTSYKNLGKATKANNCRQMLPSNIQGSGADSTSCEKLQDLSIKGFVDISGRNQKAPTQNSEHRAVLLPNKLHGQTDNTRKGIQSTNSVNFHEARAFIEHGLHYCLIYSDSHGSCCRCPFPTWEMPLNLEHTNHFHGTIRKSSLDWSSLDVQPWLGDLVTIK